MDILTKERLNVEEFDDIQLTMVMQGNQLIVQPKEGF